ncbi:MAG TPA: 2-oxoglutarate dehydrogenase E1 component [Dongiaceae bacterium]|nr:2-oxoglutarate dehydrogenase E1 component [Dongiaceae bacterium]
MGDTAVRDAFRRWGYLQADLDPLGRLQPLVHGEIEAALQGGARAGGAKGGDADRWKTIYAGSIGVEFMHLRRAEVAAWVAARMEAEPAQPDRQYLLRRLAEAELVEQFMHQRWVGSKRYSLEGTAALVPLLDSVIDASGDVQVTLIAMSHRGRLNVMINNVGRAAVDVFARFEDIDPRAYLGGGDLRYHLGATGVHRTASGREVKVHLVSNPSHLEAVDPVMMGRARARQERIGAEGGEALLPICLHGDAAFAGQGVAAETLNLDGLPGYTVGGTVQVVVNNLIGFTAAPVSLHGSRYASDMAHRLDIPIFHVNGNDAEAVWRVGRIAGEYRRAFGTDLVIDLIGFRRHGHSEVDDPTTSHPLLYAKIEKTPRLWEAYGKQIGADPAAMKSLEREILDGLSAAREAAGKLDVIPDLRTLPDYWRPYVGGPYQRSLEVDTAVLDDRLESLGRGIVAVPPGFTLHPKVAKGMEQRLEMALGRRPVDWGAAELLAFGSLLEEGVPIRLTGQDCRRGTFNQRHSVLFDHATGAEHVPLNHLADEQAGFAVYDSPLSEAAAIGYEYGYSRDAPDALVLWEAQFGDFANGGQVLIDQFVSAGEDKWVLWSGLVMLLPHGYEGQGPEHSSARLERFLQLCAEDNIQVCQPSNAGQYFHLIRRQALRRWRKPLVVMTPKGFLRDPAACVPRTALATGRFEPVLGDTRPPTPGARVLVCTGMVAHKLRARRESRKEAARDGSLAVVTLEQLYPFPDVEVKAALAPYGDDAEIVWVQEEPANMGAEQFVRRRLQDCAGGRPIKTVHRSASASPATGSHEAHALEHEALLALACAMPARVGR